MCADNEPRASETDDPDGWKIGAAFEDLLGAVKKGASRVPVETQDLKGLNLAL
jgi:hypothetical protein